MTLEEAFAEISLFWPGGQPFTFGQGQAAERLATEFGCQLPAELTSYLNTFCPATDVQFDAVDNSLELYGLPRLGPRQPGYSFNARTNQPSPDWPASFFLLADVGADPVVLDLAAPEAGVLLLRHGAGNWHTGGAVANTLGQFMLCAAAMHHALNGFEAEPRLDDGRDYHLAPRAAAWLFPRLKRWAGPYYANWCGMFANA